MVNILKQPYLLLLFMGALLVEFAYSKVINNVELEEKRTGRIFELDLARRRCPLCDSSVYSYCSDKLFHDSCCCNNPNNPYYPLPPQCQLADCSFLHANTCAEHKLITACCCVNHLTNFFQRI